MLTLPRLSRARRRANFDRALRAMVMSAWTLIAPLFRRRPRMTVISSVRGMTTPPAARASVYRAPLNAFSLLD